MPPFWPHFQPSFLAVRTAHSPQWHHGLTWRHWGCSHFRSWALAVPSGLHVLFVLTVQSSVQCRHLRAAFSEHPCLNGRLLLWLCPCYLPRVLTARLLVCDRHTVFLLHWSADAMKAREQRLCLLSTLAFQQCLAGGWVRCAEWGKCMGWPLWCFYTVVYSSSWNTWHHQPLVSSASGSPGSVADR